MSKSPLPKVSLGIAAYGRQPPGWWRQLVDHTAVLWREGIEYVQTYHQGGSAVDINRNTIVHDWREDNKSEWIFWIDADNPPPIGSLHRLLSLQQPMVSGLYYGGNLDNEMTPIAYIRNKQGAYNSLKTVRPLWEKGEILQVDAVGMGCFLTHRSVYDKILEDFEMYQRYSGGLIALKKDAITGEIPDKPVKHPYANKVKNGIFYEPIVKISHRDPKFPFFMNQFMRTEDMHFCELVRDSHEIWLDTTVEVPHIKDQSWQGKHYRYQQNLLPDPSPQEIDYV